MKDIATSSFNKRFLKVQEEIKNILSIITGIIIEESQDEQNFDQFKQNSISEEDRLVINELEKSIIKINTQAEEYHKNIGTPFIKNVVHKNVPKKIKPIQYSKHPTNITKTTTIIQKDGYDIEL